jgi:hypothetical protein
MINHAPAKSQPTLALAFTRGRGPFTALADGGAFLVLLVTFDVLILPGLVPGFFT